MKQSNRPRALVTGGAKRVGREIALTLARAGCDVTITYNGSETEAKATVEDLRTLGALGEAARLPLDDLEDVSTRAEALSREHERWDVVVLSASVYEPSPLGELTAERVLRDYTVNAAAPLMIVRALRAGLDKSILTGGGAIVAMCDIHAMGRPRKDFASYAMSKAALAEMVESLARDLAPRIRVNGVAPGVVAWPEKGYESDRAMQESYLKRVPLERAGTPAEAAEAVRWLALEARYTTGQVVRVDGGRWLA